jgi:hypothetical protein
MTSNNLNQRVGYLKKLLDICSINRYGFSDEELIDLVGMSTDKIVELLIKLNQLADSKIKLYGTCECPTCEENIDGINIDTFSDNERRYRTAGI